MTPKNNYEKRTASVDIILDILSSVTRRKILSILAEEPMYFNQLARKVHVGQQAILRHMETLEKYGIVESYLERSTLGAPSRKYYKVRTSFSLSVSLSKDSFYVINREVREATNNRKNTSNLYKNLESLPIRTESLIRLKETLIDVENQIVDLEERLNDLHALKQKILSNLHAIFQGSRFGPLERDIIYKVIRNSPDNLEDLSSLVDENLKDTIAAVCSLYDKLDSTNAKKLLHKYHKYRKYRPSEA
jgi:ArsR family transcriptional regulator